MEEDASYKKLFSYPQMVEDLLRGFVHEPWVAEVNFATLEKVSGSYVTDDLREREDDVICATWQPRCFSWRTAVSPRTCSACSSG